MNDKYDELLTEAVEFWKEFEADAYDGCPRRREDCPLCIRARDLIAEAEELLE